MKPTDFQSKMWCFITVVKPSRQRVSMQFGAIIPPLFCSSRNLPLSRIAHSLFLSTVSRSVWIFRAAWPIAIRFAPHSRGWWQACLRSGNAEFIFGGHVFPMYPWPTIAASSLFAVCAASVMPTRPSSPKRGRACRLPIAPRKHIIAFCYLLPGGRMSVRNGAISPEDIDFGGDSPL